MSFSRYSKSLESNINWHEVKLKELAIEKIELRDSLHELESREEGLKSNLQYLNERLKDLDSWFDIIDEL